jgi:ankyrin repeat protein
MFEANGELALSPKIDDRILVSRRCKMKKRIIVAVVLAVLMTASASAQMDFLEAVHSGDASEVQAAIDRGANVNAQDELGWTPLMGAAGYNEDPDVIDTLVESGANIETRNKDGGTALMIAAERNGNPDVITVLLKAGANAKAKDSDGWTAFDYAQNNKNLVGTGAYRQLEEASQ